jgi:predicted oxidoreductase
MAYRADVIVVGGGIAGMVTALGLLDRRQSVLLLERQGPTALGGLAQWALGGVFLVDTPLQRKLGIKDSAELAFSDWQSYAEFGPEDYWPKQWAEFYVHQAQQELYPWLTRRSVEFASPVFWVERGLYAPGNSVPRFHVVWGTGRRLVELLEAQLFNHPERSQLTVCFRHRVDQLRIDNGRVCGCEGLDLEAGRPFAAHGSAVVLASGGITGNLERVRRHWYPAWGSPPELLLNGSHEAADGAMQDRVRELGGRITHLDKHWHYAAGVHHPTPRHNLHGLSLIPPKSGLWVNAEGRRLGPPPLVPGFDTRYLVEQICKQEHKYSWQVLNFRIAARELEVAGSEFNEALVARSYLRLLAIALFGNRRLVRALSRTCQDFVVAESLGELVRKMNALNGDTRVREDLLTAEIERYDANIQRGKHLGNDDQLRRIAHLRQYIGDRARTCVPRKILDPRGRPLLAIREFIVTRKTLGGMQTDLGCRILGQTGEPVPGLYAVGEAAGFGGGGINGLRALEGTFLGTCIVTGRRAAEAITRG